MNDCIFCKIIAGKIPSEKIFEDNLCFVFKDINPADEIHYLLVPKKHIPTVADVAEKDEQLLGHLIITAKKIAKKKELVGYKLLFNVGKSAGQVVFHTHLHLIGHKKR